MPTPKPVTYLGQTRTLTEWASYYGVSPATVSWHVKRKGERAALDYLASKAGAKGTRPVRVDCSLLEPDGTRLSLNEASFKYGVALETMRGRIKRGLPFEQIISKAARVDNTAAERHKLAYDLLVKAAPGSSTARKLLDIVNEHYPLA